MPGPTSLLGIREAALRRVELRLVKPLATLYRLTYAAGFVKQKVRHSDRARVTWRLDDTVTRQNACTPSNRRTPCGYTLPLCRLRYRDIYTLIEFTDFFTKRRNLSLGPFV